MYLPVPGVAMVAGHERYGGGITTPGGKPTMSVMCFGFDTFADASYACWDIHTRWAEKMDKRFGGAPNIRDFIVVPEGVFKSDEEIWEAMTETIIEAGYEGRAGFQMDVATDTYHNKEDGKYYGLFNNQPKISSTSSICISSRSSHSSFWRTRSTRTIMTRPRL